MRSRVQIPAPRPLTFMDALHPNASFPNLLSPLPTARTGGSACACAECPFMGKCSQCAVRTRWCGRRFGTFERRGGPAVADKLTLGVAARLSTYLRVLTQSRKQG